MIITGIITFATAILFWCAAASPRSRPPPPPPARHPRRRGQTAGMRALWRRAFCRFFFPDSPANAWFLTPEERVIAVERIKVNQAGVENKRWKREQCVARISLSWLGTRAARG